VATVLVVGADRGIAYCVATQLHKRGDDMIAACLGDGDALGQLGIRVEPGADVTSQTAIRELADRLRATATRLDWIVHVAGVLGLDELGSIDYDDVRRQFEINAIGPLRTIEALRDLLADGAKVGIVTSRVGSLADNGSGGMYAYRMSKAAANMAGLNLHHDLAQRGVSVLMLHPGMVATDLTRDFPGNHAYIQPDEAAAGLIRDMDELTPETSGRFRHANGEYLPW
jgi:2-glutathionyl-2-methylbut-3-en-1-ol dehydrogenase